MATRALPQLSLRRCTAAAATSSAPAARTFFQLAHQRNAPPMLDFLLPSIPTSAAPRSAFQHTPRSFSKVASSRPFTASAMRATTAIYNPRKDDEGNDMTIEITPRAADRLAHIIARDQNPRLALRITVESGGCHGFQYQMSLTNVPPIDASTSQPVTDADGVANDKSAAALDEDDTLFEGEKGAMVVMDGPSLELLKGSKVDFTTELIGSQFKIADNPLATSSCGCGTSFDIKM
ncbi:hypothetical protein V497_02235 [Pseudogymnoascus sp. VKM F-4516 (FW-969)]|nr:hypothetical protein V497_02235 [Pseudogymnoascus sp. VKM F-4516 (FW-969)]